MAITVTVSETNIYSPGGDDLFNMVWMSEGFHAVRNLHKIIIQ